MWMTYILSGINGLCTGTTIVAVMRARNYARSAEKSAQSAMESELRAVHHACQAALYSGMAVKGGILS